MSTRQESDTSQEIDGVTARYHHLLIRSQPGLEIVINAMPSMALVLNRARQIVYANKAFLNVALNTDAESQKNPDFFTSDANPLWENLLGLRIGEALKCVQVGKSHLKCGMTPNCRHCGIWQALSWCIEENKTDPVICRMRREETPGRNDQTLLFSVSTTPLKIMQWDFLLLVLTDISNEVSCKMLEHVLFHDIRDITDGILSIANTLKEKQTISPEDLQLIYQVLSSEAARASDELMSHKTLIQAERGALKTHPVPVDSLDILKDAVSFFENAQPGTGVCVKTDKAKNTRLITDKTLLGLILRNMLFSAAETAGPDDTITAGCRHEETSVEFHVRSTSVLHEDSRSQLFSRSFTARDTSLGINTYAMKRIGECYLDGAVSCTSSAADGTVFAIRLPIGNR